MALGTAIGGVARHWLATWAVPFSRALPWGTVGINVIGSFAIGFFGTLTLASGRYPASKAARVFFMVGVCGGFTTFSSLSLQTLDLLRAGASGRALINVCASVVFRISAVAFGHAAASRLNDGMMQVAKQRSKKRRDHLTSCRVIFGGQSRSASSASLTRSRPPGAILTAGELIAASLPGSRLDIIHPSRQLIRISFHRKRS